MDAVCTAWPLFTWQDLAPFLCIQDNLQCEVNYDFYKWSLLYMSSFCQFIYSFEVQYSALTFCKTHIVFSIKSTTQCFSLLEAVAPQGSLFHGQPNTTHFSWAWCGLFLFHVSQSTPWLCVRNWTPQNFSLALSECIGLYCSHEQSSALGQNKMWSLVLLDVWFD